MNHPVPYKLNDFGGIDPLIELALREDIGSGDVTTDPLPFPDKIAMGRIVAKEPLVIAGLDIVRRVFEKFGAPLRFSPCHQDGEMVAANQLIAEVKTSLRALLMGERTALNFLQRLSGIATHVRNIRQIIRNPSLRLTDTRKTIPGWRILEKYAVRVGGGHNHRMGLFDGVLIKDNHIVAYGGISKAIHHIRNHASHLLKIEVEVSNFDQLNEALEAGADIIMLDNMDIDDIKRAVAQIKGRALVEVSGRITPESLGRLSDTGVDIVSMGALTHSAVFVDISMKIQDCAESSVCSE